MTDTLFPKHDTRIQCVTIDEHGALTFLATDANDIFLELGETKTRRASHVEPATFLARRLFHILRLFGDKTRVAAWTRTWTCFWRVNTAPVGGPVLKWKHVIPTYDGHPNPDSRVARWSNRQAAIDAEIKFLNNWFLTR